MIDTAIISIIQAICFKVVSTVHWVLAVLLALCSLVSLLINILESILWSLPRFCLLLVQFSNLLLMVFLFFALAVFLTVCCLFFFIFFCENRTNLNYNILTRNPITVNFKYTRFVGRCHFHGRTTLPIRNCTQGNPWSYCCCAAVEYYLGYHDLVRILPLQFLGAREL